ncbi:MAG: hypothetical protein L0Z62_31275, partial [Gemmataceae bacterium]|nr:hypothetical protein [Gemmataceae bacterium]
FWIAVIASASMAGLPPLAGFVAKEAVFESFTLIATEGEAGIGALAGRPDLMAGRTSLTVYEGMTGMMENAFINVKSTSHTITAEVDIPKGGGKGVIICQGGRFAGWSLYMKDGKVAYVHNWFDADRYTITAKEAVPAGKATIRYEFAYDGGKPGSGGKGTLFVNGQKVAEGRIEKTVPNIFSADETADVGVDDATPVTEDYKERDNRFNGRIRRVTIELPAGKAGAAAPQGANEAVQRALHLAVQEELRKARAEVKAAK